MQAESPAMLQPEQRVPNPEQNLDLGLQRSST